MDSTAQQEEITDKVNFQDLVIETLLVLEQGFDLIWVDHPVDKLPTAQPFPLSPFYESWRIEKQIYALRPSLDKKYHAFHQGHKETLAKKISSIVTDVEYGITSPDSTNTCPGVHALEMEILHLYIHTFDKIHPKREEIQACAFALMLRICGT